jgi:hypothetical protein
MSANCAISLQMSLEGVALCGLESSPRRGSAAAVPRDAWRRHVRVDLDALREPTWCLEAAGGEHVGTRWILTRPRITSMQPSIHLNVTGLACWDCVPRGLYEGDIVCTSS